LVERAVEAKRAGEKDERRRRGRAYDEIWCIHDVDEHQNLHEAAELANANGIKLGISNPCIELWFVLHFQDQTAYIERGAAQSLAKELLGCEKALTEEALSMLDERYDDAVNRAKGLDAKHHGDGSPPGSNPSSSIWPLLESIQTS
jgi:hypothetical protein